MTDTYKPTTEDETRDAVAQAAEARAPMEIVAGGSKRDMGRPTQTRVALDMSGLSGVLSYEPEELVLKVLPGTPLAEIEDLLAAKNQAFAFEPMDPGPLLGGSARAQTIGGVVSCGLSGPRRVKAGGVRDHVLGFRAVTGRGEVTQAGGQVVKNVTGYDLPKLITGSWGTLGVLTEVSLKVLPAPEKTWTVLLLGLDDDAGVAALSTAMQSPHEVASVAHLPAAVAARSKVSHVRDAGTSVTAIRLEGPGPSTEHRAAEIRKLFDGQLGGGAPLEELHSQNSAAFWAEVRDVKPFAGQDGVVWKISVPPTKGPDVASRIAAATGGDAEWFYDWSGGLVWMRLPENDGAWAEHVRGALPAGIEGGEGLVDGHAMLVRAPATVRNAVPVFQPQQAGVAALSRRIKESFDPNGVLNPGRMYAGV